MDRDSVRYSVVIALVEQLKEQNHFFFEKIEFSLEKSNESHKKLFSIFKQ